MLCAHFPNFGEARRNAAGRDISIVPPMLREAQINLPLSCSDSINGFRIIVDGILMASPPSANAKLWPFSRPALKNAFCMAQY